MFYWCTNTMAFVACHLKLYWSLSDECHSLASTCGASSWGSSWFTSRSWTCIAYTISIYGYRLLGSINWILKWYFHINIYVWSFKHSLLFTHIEKLWKILKNWFIEFESTLLFSTLLKEAGIGSKWILLIGKFLFISSHAIWIINFPLRFIW